MEQLDGTNIGVIFKKSAPFTDYISEINNTQIDNARYIDVIMPMYKLIEYGIIIRKNEEDCGNTKMIKMII